MGGVEEDMDEKLRSVCLAFFFHICISGLVSANDADKDQPKCGGFFFF